MIRALKGDLIGSVCDWDRDIYCPCKRIILFYFGVNQHKYNVKHAKTKHDAIYTATFHVSNSKVSAFLLSWKTLNLYTCTEKKLVQWCKDEYMQYI